jgi:hypothetical protein
MQARARVCTSAPLRIHRTSSSVARRTQQQYWVQRHTSLQWQSNHQYHQCGKRWTATTTASSKRTRETAWSVIRERKIEFLTIPCVAAFVGIMVSTKTNHKMDPLGDFRLKAAILTILSCGLSLDQLDGSQNVVLCKSVL